MEGTYLTPRLSTAHGPIIEGQFIYFCLNCKNAGEGSVVHYHPNELFIFPISGKVNSMVGKDRRIVSPGTFIHLPPFGQHQMTATEDGPLQYLYIKDKTWSTVGLSVEESVPDRATSLEEAQQEFERAGWDPGKGKIKKDSIGSSAIVEGLEKCYYPIIKTPDMPPSSADHRYLFVGTRMRFEFIEIVKGFEETQSQSQHEQFWYLLHGELNARVGDENHQVVSGGIIHIPRGPSYHISADKNTCVRYLCVSSTPVLESTLEK
jgi:quercetin dioxygenase-like cupin family protein